MENNLVLLKIAKDFSKLDNQSVIKTAGIVQRLRSWYNSLFDPEYKQNVQNMREESQSVKMYLNQLSKYIDKYEASVSNGNIDSYNFSVDKIKEITSELIKVMSNYRETADKAAAPAEATSKESSLSGIHKVYFTDKMKSSERVVNAIAKAIMNSGYDKLKSETLAKDPQTFLAIEEAITKGQVIGSEIALPSKQTPNRAGELWVYIQTQPFKLPNEDISLQLEVVVTDLSQRENNPRPLMAVKSISSIKARKTANKKNNIVKKASETLAAINGLETKSSEFKRRLVEVANNVSIKPEYLAAVMSAESGMKADAINPMGGAVGLIQFMPQTLKNYNIDPQSFGKLSDVQQLDYVEKFYSPHKGRLNTIGDVYMATFLPKFVGKPEDTIIAQKDNMDFISRSEGLTYDKVYRYNKGFDYDKDGIIRISDVSNKVKNIYSAALSREPISVNEEPMANEDSEMKELASYLGISLAKPLTNIVKKAILEKKVPKNTVVISLGSDDISGTMAYSYVLSNALEAGIDADTKIYSKDNNIEIVCTANGSLDNIKSAIKGILNIINHQFIKRHSFIVESNFINKVSSNNEIKYSDLLKGKRKFALKGELREKS